jgi:hypothetical protein
MNSDNHRSFGVFKPVGHLIVSLPSGYDADAAQRALSEIGIEKEAIHRLSDIEMLEQIEHDLRHASPLANLGQEINLIKSHQEMARRGHHWLVIRVKDDAQAERIADALRDHGAASAQLYGSFIIQELISPPDGTRQVSESPDRGLDSPSKDGKPVPIR